MGRPGALVAWAAAVVVFALASALPAIAGQYEPRPGLHTGAVADAGAWQRLLADGLGTVIDLRTEAERRDRPDDRVVALARVHGLQVHHLPIAGADDLTLENVERLRQALDTAHGRVLMHCSDGDRSGALLALMAHFEEGLSRRRALALGRRAGLSSLETDVQLRLRRLRR